MSIQELNSKVNTYREILSQIAELEAQAEAIKDAIKAKMVEESTETLSGNGWKASWKNVVSARFDSKAFKADHADLFTQYSKPTVSTRFLLA